MSGAKPPPRSWSINAFCVMVKAEFPWVASTHGLGWVEIFKGFLVGWVGGVLAWSSLWSEVQTGIWPS